MWVINKILGLFRKRKLPIEKPLKLINLTEASNWWKGKSQGEDCETICVADPITVAQKPHYREIGNHYIIEKKNASNIMECFSDILDDFDKYGKTRITNVDFNIQIR